MSTLPPQWHRNDIPKLLFLLPLESNVAENAEKRMSQKKHVKQAKGAAGIDRQSLSAFEVNLDRELDSLLLELQEKRYQPSPVKRVIIPKDGGGERALGIPTVRDRIVQQTLHNLLEPLFEVDFHPSSYGYRKGRSI